MDSLDLVRIAGILLDNAIEACQECEEPCMDLAMIKTPQGVTIIIRNNYIKKEYRQISSDTLWESDIIITQRKETWEFCLQIRGFCL